MDSISCNTCFIVRIITVLMETADPNILIGLFLSMILNYVIIGVAVAYTPKEKTDEETSEAKKSN